MADYNSILGAVQDKAAADRQAAADLQKLFYAMGQNQVEQAKLEEQATTVVNDRTETVESARQRLQAEMEAQQKSRAFAQSFNYDAISYSIQEETKKTIQQKLQIADKIQKDASVSLWEDPGLALLNAFTLPWDQQELAGTDQKLVALQDAATKVNAQITTYAETTSKLKESLTQESLDSLTQGIANEQRIKAVAARNKALALDAEGIEAVSQMRSAELQALQAGYNIIASEEQRQYMREQRALAFEQREALRQDKDKVKNLILEDVELVKRALRDTSPDGTVRFSDDQIRQSLEAKRPFMLKLLERGEIMAFQGRAAFGENPVETMQFLQATGMPATTDEQLILTSAVATAVQTGSAVPGDKNAKAAASKVALDKKFDEWQSNVADGSKTNPLGLPAFETIRATAAVVGSENMSGMEAKAREAIPANPGYQFIADLTTDPKIKDQQIDIDLIYGRVINAVADNKLKIEDAARLITDIGISSKEYVTRINKVYQFTGRDQTEAIAYVTVGNAKARAALAAAPLVAASGLSSVVGALPAGVAATGLALYGIAGNARVPVNILNPAAVKEAITAGLVNRLSTAGQVNLSGEKQTGDTGFYPSLFKAQPGAQ